MSNSPKLQVQLLKTAFMVYNHADLDKAKEFLIDFGLQVAFKKPGQEIYFKDYGTEPHVYVAHKASKPSFGGAAYMVDSPSELEKVQKIPGASAVTQLEEQAGGGHKYMNIFPDPILGMPRSYLGYVLVMLWVCYNHIFGILLVYPRYDFGEEVCVIG